MAEKRERMTVRTGPAEQPVSQETLAPIVDIYETEDGTLMVEAELPGAAQDKIDIRVDKGVLTITADAPVPEPEGDYSRTYTGFVSGQFFRAFALSDEIDRDHIEAVFADGVLALKLPKAAAARTRKIEIKAG